MEQQTPPAEQSMNRGHNHPLTREYASVATMRACPQCMANKQEYEELVREAAPLYKELLCSNPFYKERENDEHFWMQYIGSGIVEAKRLVANSKVRSNHTEKPPQ